MKLDDILKRKLDLQSQLDSLRDELVAAKGAVIEEISLYIKEFNITFIEMKDIYEKLNLSTALIQIVTPKEKVPNQRKGYKYFNRNNGRWFNGYQTIP